MASSSPSCSRARIAPQLISQVLAVMERHGMRPPRVDGPARARAAHPGGHALDHRPRLQRPRRQRADRRASTTLADIGTPEEILQHESCGRCPRCARSRNTPRRCSAQLRSRPPHGARRALRRRRPRVVDGWWTGPRRRDGRIGAVTSGSGLIAGSLPRTRTSRGALDPRLLRPDREHGADDAHDRAEPARAVAARAVELTATRRGPSAAGASPRSRPGSRRRRRPERVP